MSDKTSQRTEEEMLDQTFVGYDEEMTVQTEDSAKDTGAAAPTDTAAKKKNQNLLVYGAMGLAALGFLGYKFLGPGNPAPQPTSEPIQQTAQQAPVQAPVPVTPQVAAVTTEPVPVPVPVVVPTQVVPNVTQAVSAPIVDPVAQYTGNTTNASLPQLELKPDTKPEVKPEVQVPVVVAANAEATTSNDKLLAQFESMLERKYDPKFSKIEKSLDEQKDVNKSIEERLARLEAGKSTKAVKSNDSSEANRSEVKEPKVVKKIVRKPIVIRHKAESHVNKVVKSEDGEVLIDRSSMKTKPEIQRIEPVYPKVEIHSVYSGRIWTKNADGTLSTFAVGDKLPTGEVIKKIDEEKEKITTDKRVISH